MSRYPAVMALVAAGAAPALADDPAHDDAPFARTEQRAQCDHYTATRQPFFGQLHLHTQYSLDAATLQTRNTPGDAYRFARGETVGLAPFFDTRHVQVPDSEPPTGGVSAHPYCLPPERCQNTATRIIQLPQRRALDFAAVTDHSEFLGETNICLFEGTEPCGDDGDCTAAGEVCAGGVCVPNGYNSAACALLRDDVSRLTPGTGAGLFIGTGWLAQQPRRLPFCNQAGDGDQDTCTLQARNVWQQIIAAAEVAYDRTPSCEFTSFVAYEYTSMPAMNQCMNSSRPCFANADCDDGDRCAAAGQCSEPRGKLCFNDPRPGQADNTDLGGDCADDALCIGDAGGNNLHRNIIFRNHNVPPAPLSYIDATTGCGAGVKCQRYQGNAPYEKSAGSYSTTTDGIAIGSPTVMLETLRELCNPEQDEPCEFLSIPHNSNLSGGAMFVTPETLRDAEVRGELERLVEIFQIKGDSECRYSKRYWRGWQPGAYEADELCSFEDMSYAKLTGSYLVDPSPQVIPASGYVRNALKNGLAYQQEHGVNPFALGFAGSLDNHNGTPTASETDYARFGAHGDNSYAAAGQMLNEAFFLGLETNGGGLTAVWAEENSRDSLFAGMHRRETYATSGTRPVVRLFGGFDLPHDMCVSGDFAATGYQHGVAMGGRLSRPRGKRKRPAFAVSALMDPGWRGHPGATLQRVQIVKGWVDKRGAVHERVFDVAGSTDIVPVDLRTCTPGDRSQGGHTQLCTVWTDPEFDRRQHAFYYARVVENPSCRWNQYYCLSRGIDCARPAGCDGDVAGYNDYEYQQCCSHAVPKAVQQRAWTSPVWYQP